VLRRAAAAPKLRTLFAGIHRPRIRGLRFELIDRVVERSDDRLVAIKSVTSAEEYLADHFPGFPVLPGVMMLEALVQAGRALVAAREEKSAKPQAARAPLVVTEVRNVRYANMVRPGQTLRVEVTLRSGDASGGSGGYDLQGVGTVDDQVAVQGRFKLTPLAPLGR
jgi:3-hydroxyacyl-[acyl-carrier-protein] dehydratase